MADPYEDLWPNRTRFEHMYLTVHLLHRGCKLSMSPSEMGLKDDAVSLLSFVTCKACLARAKREDDQR